MSKHRSLGDDAPWLKSLQLAAAEQKTARIAQDIRARILWTLAKSEVPDKELAAIEANMARGPDEAIIVNFVRAA
jgi:hypothetical protein